MRKAEHVVALKPAVVEREPVPFVPGPPKLAGRTIHAENRNFAKAFGKSARIKSWAAAEFDHFLPGCRFLIRPNSADHSLGIVPEKPFAAENIKPRNMLKQTIG